MRCPLLLLLLVVPATSLSSTKVSKAGCAPLADCHPPEGIPINILKPVKKRDPYVYIAARVARVQMYLIKNLTWVD